MSNMVGYGFLVSDTMGEYQAKTYRKFGTLTYQNIEIKSGLSFTFSVCFNLMIFIIFQCLVNS